MFRIVFERIKNRSDDKDQLYCHESPTEASKLLKIISLNISKTNAIFLSSSHIPVLSFAAQRFDRMTALKTVCRLPKKFKAKYCI